MEKRRVVITGLGAVTPLANNYKDTWQAVLEGRSGVGPITRFNVSDMSAKIAAEVKNFDPKSVLEAKEVKKHDLFSQYSLSSAVEAWNDAGLKEGDYHQPKMGCIIGVGLGGLSTLEEQHKAYIEGGARKLGPFLIPRIIANLGPGNIAIRLGLKGVNFTIASACTSSTHAIGESARMIANGIQDLIVTGGTESTITPIGVGGFCAMRALSTRNDEPTKASRPFDKDRDGFVMGEGAAVLVLEEYEMAKKRGAKIYAEVTGYGASCDAYHITSPTPEGAGARACMTEALTDAGLKPSQIGYINAHGTSTHANDQSESVAIEFVFGDWAKNGLAVSSTKSMTGHLLGAAGAIEAMFCSLAINEGVLPPTINLDNPDESCRLNYIPHKPRVKTVDHVMSNSFGFGGTNASIILSRVK